MRLLTFALALAVEHLLSVYAGEIPYRHNGADEEADSVCSTYLMTYLTTLTVIDTTSTHSGRSSWTSGWQKLTSSPPGGEIQLTKTYVSIQNQTYLLTLPVSGPQWRQIPSHRYPKGPPLILTTLRYHSVQVLPYQLKPPHPIPMPHHIRALGPQGQRLLQQVHQGLSVPYLSQHQRYKSLLSSQRLRLLA